MMNVNFVLAGIVFKFAAKVRRLSRLSCTIC